MLRISKNCCESITELTSTTGAHRAFQNVSSRFALIGLLVLSILGGPALIQLSAQDLKIDTEVLMGSSGRVVSENVTIFHQGMVYDFRFDPGDIRQLQEVVVFRIGEMGQGEFVLLDPTRHVRLDLDAKTLTNLVTQMSSNPVLRDRAPHLIAPDFEEQWDEQEGELVLSSPRVTYRARGARTTSGQAMDLYHDFANWYAKLNAADPRKMPPFARLSLNDAIHRRGIMPEHVELELTQNDRGSRPIRVQSRHYVVWTLGRTDMDFIRQAQAMLSDFRPIVREGYFRLHEETAN